MQPTSAYDIADELRRRKPGLGVVQLHKLLYYIQGWHLAWHDTPAFNEEIRAWDNGPVVADLWRHEEHKTERPAPKPVQPPHVITIERVLERYGRLSGTQLIDMTHDETPWHTAYTTARSSVITHSSIQMYFTKQDPDQGWFWDPEWSEGEREADVDIRSGNTTVYDNAEEFLSSL